MPYGVKSHVQVVCVQTRTSVRQDLISRLLAIAADIAQARGKASASLLSSMSATRLAAILLALEAVVTRADVTADSQASDKHPSGLVH